MMKLIEMQVKDYLQLVASDAPAPGGGSASALCGAQGIGLISMVAKLTAGKEKFSSFRPVCETVIAEADDLCAKLARQIDLDTEAYGQIAASFQLPKQTDEQKGIRKKAIADATRYAAEVPLETMRLAMRGMECAAALMGSYNTNCASDVGCGVCGILACVRGAWLNVRINAGGSPDDMAMQQLKVQGQSLSDRAEALGAELAAKINADI